MSPTVWYYILNHMLAVWYPMHTYPLVMDLEQLITMFNAVYSKCITKDHPVLLLLICGRNLIVLSANRWYTEYESTICGIVDLRILSLGIVDYKDYKSPQLGNHVQ